MNMPDGARSPAASRRSAISASPWSTRRADPRIDREHECRGRRLKIRWRAHQEMIMTLTNDDMHNVTAYLDTLK